MKEGFPQPTEDTAGSGSAPNGPIITEQALYGPQSPAVTPHLPKGLNQFDHLERIVTKNGAERIYGVDEEGKKRPLSHDYVAKAYGYDPSDKGGTSEEEADPPNIYEEYKEAVASDTNNAKDLTFREWVKAGEVKRAAKWYTETRAHGEAPDEIDPDTGPTDNEITGLMNKDHQERLNAREGRSNPTKDDIDYYRWLKDSAREEANTREQAQNDTSPDRPDGRDPTAPTEPLPIEKRADTELTPELKKEIIRNEFLDPDNIDLILTLGKSFKEHQRAYQEYAKKKHPGIIEIGHEKASRDRYEVTKKVAALYLKDRLESYGFGESKATSLITLEGDLAVIIKKMLADVPHPKRLKELDKIIPNLLIEATQPEDTEQGPQEGPESPTEVMPKPPVPPVPPVAPKAPTGENVPPPKSSEKTEVKDPVAEAQRVYPAEEVLQRMTDIVGRAKNEAYVPSEEEYADILKLTHHIQRRVINSNAKSPVFSYNYVRDAKHRFDAKLTERFLDIANPQRWLLSDMDRYIYTPYVITDGKDELPEQYAKGEKGALLTRNKFRKLRRELLTEEQAAEEAAQDPQERESDIQKDYIEYLDNSLKLSAIAKELIAKEKAERRRGGVRTLVRRPAQVLRRSAVKPNRR